MKKPHIFPDWKAHDFLKKLPFTDDMGFVITDLYMRNPDYQNIFAVGDAASITVPTILLFNSHQDFKQFNYDYNSTSAL